jgi:hypothetical protein
LLRNNLTSFLGPNIFSSAYNIWNLCFSIRVRDHISTLYKIIFKVGSMYRNQRFEGTCCLHLRWREDNRERKNSPFEGHCLSLARSQPQFLESFPNIIYNNLP